MRRVLRLLSVVTFVLFFFLAPYFLSSLSTAQSQAISERKADADRLSERGYQEYRFSKYSESIQLWDQSLGIYRSIHNRIAEANTLNDLGRSYRSLSEYKRALEHHQQALSICKELGDRKSKSNLLINLSNVYKNFINSQQAFAYHQPSNDVKQQNNNRGCEASSLNKLGNVYIDLGKYKESIDFSKRALAIFHQIGDLHSEAIALNSIGIAYDYLADFQQALTYYQESIKIFKQFKDVLNESKLLNNIGLTYRNLSQYQQALSFSKQSLIIARQIGDRQGESNSLGIQAFIYRSLGQYQRAIEFYQQSIIISRQIGDLQSHGLGLNGIGLAYRNLNQFEKSIEFYQQSLPIFKQIGDLSSEGNTFTNIGNAYYSLGQYQKAIEFFRQSLAIQKQNESSQGQARALNALGNAHHNLNQNQSAITYYLQALAINKKIGDRDAQGNVLSNLASTFDQLDRSELAIMFYKQAVMVRESIRKDIRELGKEARNSYLDTVASSYRTLTDLLLKKGRVTEALQVLDLLKIQELEDYLKNIKGNDTTAQGIQLLEPEKAISAQLPALSLERIQELNRQLANQIQQLPKSEINKVPEYLQNIPQGVVLIYPLILSDRLELIVYSLGSIPTNHTIPIKKVDLKILVSEFGSELRDYGSEDVKIVSKKLYDILIKPIEAELKQVNADTILYAPDGFLRYIPLAALYDGKQYLVEKYRINNLIAYSLFDSNYQSITNIRIYAGAFGGKAGEVKFGQNGLPASIPEIENITASFPNTNQYIEQNFTVKTIKEKVSGNNIVHFATHAEFRSSSPLDSYVLFGDGSKITLAEISDLPLKDTALVVLSACQTGLGGTLGTGAEILGFGYQVQRAGAKASISSLWSVSDGGTQLLMQNFYKNLQKGNISTSTALREAQLSMIRKPIKEDEVNFSHPFFWSAFVVIGNGL